MTATDRERIAHLQKEMRNLQIDLAAVALELQKLTRGTDRTRQSVQTAVAASS